MKYAFIDYENLNSLNGVKLEQYEKIFIFIGAAPNQAEIRISEKFTDKINISLITVKQIAQNNVDFHLSYYLGKLDQTAPKSVEFHVLSKDLGYQGICNFIRQQKTPRHCLLVQPESAVKITKDFFDTTQQQN
ncbi:hypothetical protein CBG46_04930 [Actinobacillus succinogenes]|uniref:PIN domain-containing protein n=1 Tax=Actinobacillus succinogenes TaxID=67854 RepID=UPI0002FDE8E1|nr:PIN domain-containing protein [Actinobacillus succinogenes]PHI40063.1 hypothetical protein CBG46_04930 [Actinobacillus succinogenes]